VFVKHIYPIIAFFKQNQIDEELLLHNLKYEFVPPGFNVITYGEFGNLFYIILHGEVSILLPNDNVIPEEPPSPSNSSSLSSNSNSWEPS
jgi:hypothetical protein